MPPSTTITDLPTELVQLICEDVSTEDIFSLGTLCHRLNSICLPLVQVNLHLPNPTSLAKLHLNVTERKDQLSALIIHLSLLRIERLVCVIDDKIPNGPGRDVHHILRSIRRLFSLASRLEYIGSVSIVFNPSVGDQWYISSELYATAFLEPFMNLIRMVLDKSGQELQVVHWPLFASSMLPSPQATSTQGAPHGSSSNLKGLAYLRNYFSSYLSPSNVINPPNTAADLSPEPHPSSLKSDPDIPISSPLPISNVGTLTLSSDLLVFLRPHFSPPPRLANITVSVPASTRLSTFTHEVLPALSHYIFFPSPSSVGSNLVHLRIGFTSEIYLGPLKDALGKGNAGFSRLESIDIGLVQHGVRTMLDFESGQDFDDAGSSIPNELGTHISNRVDLPNLRSFTGSARHAAFLFASSSTRALSVPKLTFINLIVDPHFHSEQSWPTKAGGTLDVLAEGLRKLNRRFEMEVDGNHDGLQSVIEPLRKPATKPTISLCLVPTIFFFSPNDPLGPPKFADRIHWSDPLISISRVTISITLFDLVEQIPEWLKIFRGTRELNVICGAEYLVPPQNIDSQGNPPTTAVDITDGTPSPGLEPSAEKVDPLAALHASILSSLPDPNMSLTLTIKEVHPSNYEHYHWANARDEMERLRVGTECLDDVRGVTDHREGLESRRTPGRVVRMFPESNRSANVCEGF